MNFAKGIAGLAGTIAIAAVIAYAVSAPRNAENAMNQDIAALGGQSINEQIAETQAAVARAQCEDFTRRAAEAWDRSLDQGTADRDAEQLDALDRQAESFCHS